MDRLPEDIIILIYQKLHKLYMEELENDIFSFDNFYYPSESESDSETSVESEDYDLSS